MIRAFRALSVVSIATSAFLLEGCHDGLLHAPAAARAVVTMRASLNSTSSGGAAEAFDRADRVFLRFSVGNDVRLAQELPFSPSASGTTVRLEVPLRQLSETITAELELRSANRALFRGNAATTLTSGVSTPLEFSLEPVVAAVACGGSLVQLGSYGQTAQLGGAALFATGDTVRDVPVAWSVPQNLVVNVSAAGEVTALQDGDAVATCTAGGVSATRAVRVFAVVSVVQVLPSSATLVVGNSLPLTATPRDARGNAILAPRPIAWTTSSANVATVSATGVVAAVVAGTVRITATSGTVAGSADVTVVSPSFAVTNAAVNITGSSATLLGTVNPRGTAAQGWFDWGTDSALTAFTSTPAKSAGSGNTDVGFSEGLTGLTPNTTYYFRMVASGLGGTVRGTTLSFTTPRPPTASTLDVSVGQAVAFVGSVNPNGSPTTAWFRYGSNPTLSTFTETAHQSIGGGTAAVRVTDAVAGLQPLTTYYVRVVGANTGGSALGEILAFTTNGPPPTLGATTSSFGCGGGVTVSCISVANMSSNANPNGTATEVWFEYGTTPTLTTFSSTTHQTIGSGTALMPFQATVSGNAPFYFRPMARNSFGTTRGAIVPVGSPGASAP